MQYNSNSSKLTSILSLAYCTALQVSNEKFCNLGLNPVTLEGSLMDEVNDITQKYQDRSVTAHMALRKLLLSLLDSYDLLQFMY